MQILNLSSSILLSLFQLIIFMALAKGTSRIRTGPITLHTQTAIHIAEQLTQVGQKESVMLLSIKNELSQASVCGKK